MRFFVITTMLLACCIAPAAVAGQTTPTNATDTPTASGPVDAPETPIAPSYRDTPTPDTTDTGAIDARNATVKIGQLDLLETGLDGETAYAVLRNDGSQSVDVTLYDAVISDGGNPAQSRQELRPGETVRVEVSTTQAGGGRRAIGILAGQSVYFDILEGDSSWFDGSPTWSETRLSALGGFAGGVFIVMFLSRRELDSENFEVNRLL